jgi:hypothetical protein
MAIVFAQDVLEIALNHTYGGRPAVNVLHVRNDETGGSDESKVVDVVANWQDHMMVLMGSTVQFEGATWRSLDPSEGTVGFTPPDATKRLVGAQTGPTLPPNVALLITKITEDRQRGQRNGRMFLAGVDETEVDNGGNISSATVATWQGYVDDFLDGINDTGFTTGSGSGLVVLNTTRESRQAGTMEVTLTYRGVTSLILDNKVSTQRDRLR